MPRENVWRDLNAAHYVFLRVCGNVVQLNIDKAGHKDFQMLTAQEARVLANDLLEAAEEIEKEDDGAWFPNNV